MTKLEFFFDCSSPWTYLGFTNIQPLAAEFGVDITWRPILVGGVFNAINDSVYRARENPIPAKMTYGAKEMKDWCRMAGVTIKYPPSIFPINSVKAMRGCFVAEQAGLLVPFAKRVFEVYWSEDRDIADDVILAEICDDAGLDKTLKSTRPMIEQDDVAVAFDHVTGTHAIKRWHRRAGPGQEA